MTSPSRPFSNSTARHETPAARFGGVPLPRGLRDDAENMSWHTFTATYSPSSGPLRLGRFECVDGDRPATRLGPQARKYEGTFAIGDGIETVTVGATGPVAALTAMLFDRGIPVEMVRFHQLKSGDHTATFIQGSDGEHLEWAMGWAEDKTESMLRAIVACANRLMSLAWYTEIDESKKRYVWRRR
ncbi:MAG: homocitrate synthase [Mycobacteriaceae bacterium]|nr:homocitrate synthase [Mycobacteriaceae bacterium]